MVSRRILLGFFLASSLTVGMTLYGCSDDSTGAPPEPDAGNPNRTPTDSGSSGSTDAPADAPPGVTYKALAAVSATGLPDAGNPTGTVSFTETNGSVAVAVTITGATPGQHGMHIHAGTNCIVDPDGGFTTVAGGHWNPQDAGHGLPTSGSHHPGDLGNITIDGTGNGTLNLNMTGYNVQPDGGELSALTHAVIFHQGTDDGVTQPTGAAGSRAGCGIINPQ